MGSKKNIGDIQSLLSCASLMLALFIFIAYGRAVAVSAYVDPITTKEDVVEDQVEDDISEVYTLELEDTTIVTEDEDVDPLSLITTEYDNDLYYEDIDTTYTPLPNDLSRDHIDINSDLHVDTCPSAEAIDELINWWAPRIMENRGTPFVGHGKDFYAVWEMTGMDPLIILGIAAWEGGWGNSKVAVAKHNYYGIGVYDSDPMYWASRFVEKDSELSEFDQVSQGIVQGALWIYENYYTKGNTTLALINNNGYNGYNGGTYWAETITEQMINVHYRVVADIIKEAN